MTPLEPSSALLAVIAGGPMNAAVELGSLVSVPAPLAIGPAQITSKISAPVGLMLVLVLFQPHLYQIGIGRTMQRSGTWLGTTAAPLGAVGLSSKDDLRRPRRPCGR